MVESCQQSLISTISPALIGLLAVLLSCSEIHAEAVIESENGDLLRDQPCDEVRNRAGAIMLGRMGGLSAAEARLYLRKNKLDGALISAAYALPRHRDSDEAFQQQEDFEELWGQRCEAAQTAATRAMR